MKNRLRIAVLVSGGGTNLQALMDRMHEGTLKARIVCVGSDRPGAFGLERARTARIPTFVVDYSRYRRGEGGLPPMDTALVDQILARQRILPQGADPVAARRRLWGLICAERELMDRLDAHRPDLVCLAGFMRLLTPHFLDHYNTGGTFRVINIHPALLPAFPGRHGYRDTFHYGCKWGGVTVHFVDEGEDSGPVIAQAVYPIFDQDDESTVQKRGLHLEYKIYAQVINWIADGVVHVEPGPGPRPRVRIADPNYREIMGSWVESAFRFA
ncbi:formyltetrahydrofolate-dependent phosphoribosylglycinamide formyltransferase [Desulfacinum hydrothermale DSM 13146]|uniref:Phosphoribosylglycinamide formyltransferase n=1 Tax=Desulfacinum hydrothermale DSM 13146 TaxID=1121390 RepID=A0A1W1XUE6_9BACT|nr:phosphoribosylglycinamide formyltransferase [Desulfacinum hydrothermale]SMC27583.1 formyltetrahydrofolate-dependent phosphoribosylglycinamide formyltransferase [Desulfacinum hydrothermale DSM 13146]